MADQRCLVLGAGFLGSHVAHHLAQTGFEVSLFSRSFNPWFTSERAEGIDIHVGRIEGETDLLRKLVGAADTIIHFASSSRPPTALLAPVQDLEQTVTPALTVLQILSDAEPGKTLMMCSSGGTVYGKPSELPTPEDHPLRPLTPYAISHAAVERYVAFYRRTYDLDAVVLRFANVYGPGELGRGGQGVIGTWLHQIAIGERPVLVGSLNVSRDFIYVEDAAQAVAALLNSRQSNVFNIGSGTTTTLLEVLTNLRATVGSEVETTLGSFAEHHPVVDIPVTHLDTTRIRAETDWSPETSITDGLESTWAWATEHWRPVEKLRSELERV